jgi:murein L,D-transpeptidase YafK
MSNERLHPASARVARVLYEKHMQPKHFIDATEHVAQWWRELADAGITAYKEHMAEQRDAYNRRKFWEDNDA